MIKRNDLQNMNGYAARDLALAIVVEQEMIRITSGLLFAKAHHDLYYKHRISNYYGYDLETIILERLLHKVQALGYFVRLEVSNEQEELVITI